MKSIDSIIHDELAQYCKQVSTQRFILPDKNLENSVRELMQSLIDAKESGIIKDYEIKDGQVYIIHQLAIQEIKVKWK